MTYSKSSKRERSENKIRRRETKDKHISKRVEERPRRTRREREREKTGRGGRRADTETMAVMANAIKMKGVRRSMRLKAAGRRGAFMVLGEENRMRPFTHHSLVQHYIVICHLHLFRVCR